MEVRGRAGARPRGKRSERSRPSGRDLFGFARKLVPPVCLRNAGSATEPPWRVSEYAATRLPFVSMSIVK